MNRTVRLVVAVWLVSAAGTACETGTSATTDEEPEQRKARSTGASPEFEYVRSLGAKGTAPGTFREPVGLAVGSDGHVVVPDAHNQRLQKLTADGEVIDVWAEGIERPMHIAYGVDERLLVPVFRVDEIRVFEGAGKPVETFGGAWLDGPSGVAQLTNGQFVVVDFYNHQFHLVSVEGALRDTVGTKGKDPGEFTYPTDVAIGVRGRIWIADAYAHRIQVFSPDLEHEKTIGGWGKQKPGTFRVATGIDLGPGGNLYVADFKNHRVQVLRPDGQPLTVVEGSTSGDRSLKHPTEVVRTETELYVTDHGHHQVDVYRSE